MKKLLLILLCLTLVCSLFGACNPSEHKFSSEWSYNETHHWKACIDDGCEEKGSYAEHVFENSECVCGATKIAPQNAMSAILNAQDNQTLLLARGNYGVFALYTEAKGVRLVFEKGSTVNMITIGEKLTGISIENLTFRGNLVIGAELDGFTLKGCSFSGDVQIASNTAEDVWLKDIVIDDCKFVDIAAGNDGKLTAIKLQRTENFTLTNCLFDNVQYNCVQFPGGKVGEIVDGEIVGFSPSLKGDIKITGNTFRYTGVRVLNLNLIEATTCDISGNTFYLHEYSWNGAYIDIDVGASGVVIGVNTWEVIPEESEKNFLFWDLGAYTYDPTEQLLLELD